MPMNPAVSAPLDLTVCATQLMADLRRQETLLKTGALQNAIFNSANFSSIATDASGVIQIFNVGAAHMLGYEAIDVLDQITRRPISLIRTS